MGLVVIQILIEDDSQSDSGSAVASESSDDIQIEEAVVEVLSDNGSKFEYSVKIINPSRLSEYKNIRICKWKECKNLDDLRSFHAAKIPSVDVNGEEPYFSVVDLGYIEPGHGTKGRKQWLNNDEDVREMYTKHAGKRNILLWAYSHVKNPSKKGETNFDTHKKVWLKWTKNMMRNTDPSIH